MKKYILLLMLFSSYVCFGQGDQLRILVPVAGASDSALVHLPNDYSTSKTLYPLVIFCPGQGQSTTGGGPKNLSSIYTSSTAGGPAYVIAQGKFPASFVNPADGQQYKFIVVSIQENTWGVTKEDLNVVIPYLVANYRVDISRIYTTAISAGGQGSLEYSGHFNITPLFKIAATVPMSPALDASEIPTVAKGLVADSVHIWGIGDPVNDLWGGNCQILVNTVNGMNPALTQFTSFNTGHGPWGTFYDPSFTVVGKNIYQWMLQFKTSAINTGGSGTGGNTGGGGSTTNGGTRYVMSPNQDSSWISTNPPYKDGDTLDFPARYHWGYISLNNYHGTNRAKPLVIINSGGQTSTYNGITLDGSTNVKVTGSGVSPIFYGFYCTNPTPALRTQSPFAVAILDRSKNIEVERVYIHNVGIGIHIETDNNCDQTLDYPQWLMDSITIHDCKIVGIWNEGVYWGNTSPDNASYDHRADQCSVIQTTPTFSLPMKMDHGHIYNMIVDSTGRGGIQAGNAGYIRIDHCFVSHNGLNGDDAQGTGISIGLYTYGDIDHNVINNTLTFAIASIGGGFTNKRIRIVNNRMDSSGFLRNYPRLQNTSDESFDPATEKVANDTFTYPYAIWAATRPRFYTTGNPAGTAVKGQDSTIFSINNDTIGLFKCFTSVKDNHAAIQIEDDNPGMQVNGDSICNNISSRGQTLAINTARVLHALNYTTCSGTVNPPPPPPPPPPACDSAGIIKAYLATHPCPTCPICPVVPAPRTVKTLKIVIDGVLTTISLTGSNITYSDDAVQQN